MKNKLKIMSTALAVATLATAIAPTAAFAKNKTTTKNTKPKTAVTAQASKTQKPKEFNYGGEKYVPTYTQNRVEVFKKIDKILGVKRDKDGWGRVTKYSIYENKNKEFWFAPLNNDWTKEKTSEECFNIFMDRVGNDLGVFELPLEVKYLLVDLNKDALTKFEKSGYNTIMPKDVIISIMSELNNKEAVKINKKSEKYDNNVESLCYNIFRTYRTGIVEDVWSMPNTSSFSYTSFNPTRDSILYSRVFDSPIISLYKGNIEYKNSEETNRWYPVVFEKDLEYYTTLGELVKKYPGNIDRKGLFADKFRDFLKVYNQSSNTFINKYTKINKSKKQYPITSISMGYNKNLKNYYISSCTNDFKVPGQSVFTETYVLDNNNSITVDNSHGASFTEPYKKLLGITGNETIEGRKIKHIITYYGGSSGKIEGIFNNVDIYIPTMNEVWDK